VAIDSDNVKIYEFHLNSNRLFIHSTYYYIFSIAVEVLDQEGVLRVIEKVMKENA